MSNGGCAPTLQAAAPIAAADSAAIAQAWFQGLNPQLGDRSPLRLLREGDLDEMGPEVIGAARRLSRRRMSCDLEAVATTGPVFRLARAPDPWAWPGWSQASLDGTLRQPLGRSRGSVPRPLCQFDPLWRTARDTCPVPPGPHRHRQGSVRSKVNPIPAGTLPGSGSTTGSWGWPNSFEPTADIGAAASLSLVRARLAGRAIHHGLTDIDAAAIRLTAPRGFTQEVSRLIYECRTAGAEPLAGIRYHSRLDDGTSNWAVFEAASDSPEPLHVLDAEPVQPDDPHVVHALAVLGLRVA